MAYYYFSAPKLCQLSLLRVWSEKKLQGSSETFNLYFTIKSAFFTTDTVENSRNIEELRLDFFKENFLLEVPFQGNSSKKLALFKRCLAISNSDV
jgi:hypothetical protein